MGGARDDSPCARTVRWHQEGCRRADGHQPAGAESLSAEVPAGQLTCAEDTEGAEGRASGRSDLCRARVTLAVNDYRDRNLRMTSARGAPEYSPVRTAKRPPA